MKNIVLSLFLAFYFLNVFVCKAQTGNECEYLQVITYLHTDSTAQETIRQSFGYTSRKAHKRIPHISFNIQAQVEFLNVETFKKLINNNLDEKSYREKYKFDLHKNDFLHKLAIKSHLPLYLIFSKPIDNYLVAEIRNIEPLEGETTKFGLGLMLFFHFDKNGLIDYVKHSRVIYN